MFSLMDDKWQAKSANPNTSEAKDKVCGDHENVVGNGVSKPDGKDRVMSKLHRSQSRSKQLQLKIDTDPLLDAEDVAARLRVTTDWVWDHSSRRLPPLPVIPLSDGTLRYRYSEIEKFIDERERLAKLHRRRR
jgi:predicted DNA-binding transcriptional regulator AlpA